MNRQTREETRKRALLVELPPIGASARLVSQHPILSGVIGKLDLRHWQGPKARLDLPNGMHVWASVDDLVWENRIQTC